MAEWDAPGYTKLRELGSGGFGEVVLARAADPASDPALVLRAAAAGSGAFDPLPPGIEPGSAAPGGGRGRTGRRRVI